MGLKVLFISRWESKQRGNSLKQMSNVDPECLAEYLDRPDEMKDAEKTRWQCWGHRFLVHSLGDPREFVG